MSERTRLDAQVDGTVRVPVNDALGFELVARDGDEVTFTWTVPPEHCNSAGGAQGGMIAAFADAALGAATAAHLPADRYPALAHMSLSLMRPARAGERLTATARVAKAGRRVLFVEARITNEDGVLVATATGTEIPADAPD